MRNLARRAALATAGTLVLLNCGIAYAAPLNDSGAPAAPTSSAPSSSASPSSSSHVVPPPAPTPSASGRSPDSPDPHPPAGGIGPNGELVGGSALHSRGLVKPTGAPALPAGITAAAWTLVDLDTGAVLAARDPHGRYQPASILKTLTSVTLLPLLPGTRTVTVSQSAANAEGSAVGIVAGGKYTIDQLFKGLLLVSGNDTAAALAEAAGGVAHTVDLMNKTAMSLGAYDTFVQTPSGLDGWQQLTSAYDMSLILRAAVNMPRFVAYDQARTAEMPAEKVGPLATSPFQITNQGNPFMDAVPGALVSKIGYTDAASHTYVAATERNGRRLGVVFLRAERWPLDQWQQAAKLFNWGYALPATVAPVGHLDAAVQTPDDIRATQSAAASIAARTTQERELLAAATTRRQWHEDVPIIVAGLLIIAGSVVAIRRFGLHRKHG
ncbi:D-alanyl-D-alanine carboxypeptidase (penicillin-binding protein 5/6) [Jatrophihabitans sp. GAS493]|uniref:D-alanyl-D-alanine carboxypeptidase family protein n=1 Tax=Jatrophihabitans sp. GAS493 TaxID=1907575 RepID=UPI000BB8A166|nr:D-alanyl-D-alanine carboxypeptidase [Jatrophihabitans sp. GAS493]SOD71957.1 D-alanyl-D-alanine carboxypeptidase (penicillin-binding protein 5/6) [Jatrophihabitans sp. GAS493]